MRSNAALSALLLAATMLDAACTRQTDVSFFVLVKSSNYTQDSAGNLNLLNYHFFSEIFVRDSGRVDEATLTTNVTSEPMAYVARDDTYYIEGGHFDTMQELDRAHPNGLFSFTILTPYASVRKEQLRLAGPDGRTDIPSPITILLSQEGATVSPRQIDPTHDLEIRWSEYSNGRADPRGIVDDMIFVVVADCHGERLFHTGLPFAGDYLTFRAKAASVARGTLRPGQPHSMFVEFPHVVDSRIIDGVPGFTSYATATYLDLHTTGAATGPLCPATPPPMDTGQTDRVESGR